MNQNQIKRTEDLQKQAPWFNLSNYEGARNFDAGDWCSHLYLRSSFLRISETIAKGRQDAFGRFMQTPLDLKAQIEPGEGCPNVRSMNVSEAFELTNRLSRHSEPLAHV